MGFSFSMCFLSTPFYSLFARSSETIQVTVQSAFMQLILILSLHMLTTGSYGHVVMHGLVASGVGALFTAVLNSFVRGESLSLRRALSVDSIDRHPEGWSDELDGESHGESPEATGAARVEYARLYEPGVDRRKQLGKLAAHDWESYHVDLERKMGLGMFDLSSQCFDEVKPDKDPGTPTAPTPLTPLTPSDPP